MGETLLLRKNVVPQKAVEHGRQVGSLQLSEHLGRIGRRQAAGLKWPAVASGFQSEWREGKWIGTNQHIAGGSSSQLLV